MKETPLKQPKTMKLQEIDLYVTMKCNLSCGFCSVRANEHTGEELSLERILALITEGRELGLEELHLIGGEPTLRTDLEQIIKFATDKGIECRVISNGTLLDRERLQKLMAAGLSNIMLSIDGLEKNHNIMRGSPTAWQKTMACVEDCIALGMRTRVSAVAFKNNVAEIPELMKLVADMGTDIFSIFLGSPLGRGENWKEQILDAYEWKDFLTLISAKLNAGQYGALKVIAEQGFLWPETEHFDRDSMSGRGTGCSTLLTDYEYLIVRADGNLYQCVFFMNDGAPIGNIKAQPLKQALMTAQNQALYKKFTVPGEVCSNCSYSSTCDGGCRGYSYLYTEDWHQPDPRCSITETSPTPPNFPLCPIAKLNLRSNLISGSSEQALADS